MARYRQADDRGAEFPDDGRGSTCAPECQEGQDREAGTGTPTAPGAGFACTTSSPVTKPSPPPHHHSLVHTSPGERDTHIAPSVQLLLISRVANTTMLLTTFDLTLVTLLAGLMTSTQARSAQRNYQPQEAAVVALDYDYTYGDSAYQYDTAEERETREKDRGQARQTTSQHRELGVPSSPQQPATFINIYNDPYDYDYTYGDPSYDYDHPRDKATERGTDDPRPAKDDQDDHEDEDDHDEDEDDSDEDEDDSDDHEDDQDYSTVAPEGEDDQDDQNYSTAAPEGKNDHEDDQEGSTTSRVLQWFKNQWYKAKRTMKKMVVGLRSAKENVVELLHQLGGVVEKGAQYCIARLKGLAHQLDSRGERALDKLMEALTAGNQDVEELFHLLGLKVQEWTERRPHHQQEPPRVRAVAGVVPAPMMHDAQYGMRREDVEMMPNFFQDAAASAKLSQLAEMGVLTEEDLRAVLGTP